MLYHVVYGDMISIFYHMDRCKHIVHEWEDSRQSECVSNTKDDICFLCAFSLLSRLLEKDSKSLSSLTSTGHSRRSSDTSQISMNMNGSSSLSGSSGANSIDDNEDDILQQWGKTVREYENLKKKKPEVLKVIYEYRGIHLLYNE